MADGKCWFILAPNSYKEGEYTPARYCGRRVGWKMVKDDDGNTVRKYNDFCNEHQAVDALPNEEDDA